MVHRVAQVVPRALCEIEQAARDGLVELDSLPSVLACDGEYCPYAPDAAHWGVASPVVDPSLLYVALSDESGFEPSVYLLLENEA